MSKFSNVFSNIFKKKKITDTTSEKDSIKKLNLSRNQNTNLAVEIGNLICLQDLNLSHNQIQNLAAEIGNLVSLKYLDLSHNQLQNLVSEIGNLHNLQELDLSHNQLQSLPAEIGNLRNLQKLDLSYNQLQNLPAEIGNLFNLQELNLLNNKLRSLPAEILKLKEIILINDSSYDLENINIDNEILIFNSIDYKSKIIDISSNKNIKQIHMSIHIQRIFTFKLHENSKCEYIYYKSVWL